MTGKVLRIAFTLLTTGLVCWGAWWLWNEVPRWLRRSEFSDYSYVASLVLIFLALSLLNPIFLWIWAKLDDSPQDH